MNDHKYIGCFVRDNHKIFSNIEPGTPIDKVWEHGQFSANTLKQAGKTLHRWRDGENLPTQRRTG